MPIKIVKKSGAVIPVASPSADVAHTAKPAKKEGYQKQIELINTHCGYLSRAPATTFESKDNVMIASLLGFGSKDAQGALWHDGRVVQEWVKIVPWFLHPDVGETILPPDAVWEIHRAEIDGGYGGWATISIPSSGKGPWKASAPSSWAAFAICLLQAFKDDAYVPSLPSN